MTGHTGHPPHPSTRERSPDAHHPTSCDTGTAPPPDRSPSSGLLGHELTEEARTRRNDLFTEAARTRYAAWEARGGVDSSTGEESPPPPELGQAPPPAQPAGPPAVEPPPPAPPAPEAPAAPQAPAAPPAPDVAE